MTRLAVLLSLVSLAGCIHAPDVVLIDRKTALEQLAAGSYRPLEDQLDAATVTPRATPLVRAEIEPASAAAKRGIDLRRGEAGQLDDLLRRHCAGEATDGTIVVTATTCTGHVDASERSRLIERVNRDRFQIWRDLELRTQPKTTDLGVVRRAWRTAHLHSVVCGGQVQRDDGTWEDKKC